MSEPKVSAETKRIIGELSLKYPVSATVSPQEHASQLALLCRDLIDIPPHLLRRAADRWSREQKWMPKASELREMARQEAHPVRNGSMDEKWARRALEGNRLAIHKDHHKVMHWKVSPAGFGTEIVQAPMPREIYDKAMAEVDIAIFETLRRAA